MVRPIELSRLRSVSILLVPQYFTLDCLLLVLLLTLVFEFLLALAVSHFTFSHGNHVIYLVLEASQVPDGSRTSLNSLSFQRRSGMM